MRRPTMYVTVLAILAALPVSHAVAQNIDAREYRLDNGMQVLMVERHDAPTIMASILARVGSANETTGITGISHLFEHMMFKGTETIGTKDIKRDHEIMNQLDSLRVLMRAEERIMREKLRRGEINDMLAAEPRTPRYKELEAVFDSLILQERELIIKDQLDELYTKNGGAFLNAFTSEDFTGYFVRLPKNKIELFMWLESDRFRMPIFREFYSERDVVREERRLGLESTPTGLIEEDFQAMFWKSSSYRWDVLGWASDLENITREQADNYYATYYAPNNLIMLLVGDLNPDEMIGMVKDYFGDIPRGVSAPPDVVTLEERQYGEKRLIAEAECSPTAKIWYHTVAWKHADSYPLEVLAGIMNDKTGRLFKKLVEEKGIAKSSGGGGPRMFGGSDLAVNAIQDSRKYAGAFRISAEGISGVKAEQLEQAIYEVIEDLKTNPVPPEELQKVKNQLRVQLIRSMDLMSGIGILFQLGGNAALGDWTEVNNNPNKCDLVTAEDIQRVANTYFASDQKSVLIINSKTSPTDEGGAEAEDPQFAQAVQMIKSVKDPARLEQMIGMFSMQVDQVTDPQQKAQMDKLLKIANDHLKELKTAGGK
ncbi:MAG: pitrilysin family protein [Candidatus Zixiibacteriota bacterium]